MEINENFTQIKFKQRINFRLTIKKFVLRKKYIPNHDMTRATRFAVIGQCHRPRD